MSKGVRFGAIKRASLENAEFSEFSSLDSENFDSLEELIGKAYKNEGYTSTTFKSNSTGWSFKDAAIVIAIRVPKGTKILGPFSNVGESEILLGRGYEFKIVGMEYIEGKLMVYTELQPRELEKSSRLPKDIPMPEIIGEKGFSNCDIPDFSEPQQEIIEDVKRRKSLYQIHSILNSTLEKIENDYSNIRTKYEDLQLDYDDNNLMLIKHHITSILNAIDENNLSLEQLEDTLNMFSNSIWTIQTNIGNLSKELEMQFCEAIGTEIQEMIKNNDTESLEQKIKDIQSEKVSIIEKFFGKDKLHNVMVENLKKQIKERKERPVKKYTNMADIFNDVLSYVRKNGMTENLQTFLSKYNIENATEEERLLFEQIMNQQIEKQKKEVYQPIPLFSIRKSTKMLQEELNRNNPETSRQKSFQVAPPSEQAKITHSLEMCFEKINENVIESSKRREDKEIQSRDID